MTNQLAKKQERVENILYVVLLAAMCLARNLFYPDLVLPLYSEYPWRLNGNLIRCSNNYFASAIDHEKNGKPKKSLRRNLFFNFIRCLLPDVIRQIIINGKLNHSRNLITVVFVAFLTVFFQYVPLKQFRKVRYVWAYLLMEYYTKHASDLIENRNTLE